MDLVEAFGARTTAHGGLEFLEHLESGASGDLVIIDAPTASTSGPDAPQLFIDTTIRQASRGRGAVTCVTASNDVILVATARGYLLRYSWDENGNERVSEVEVVGPKQLSDHRIAALFMDPWANHVLVALRGPGGGGGAGGGGGGSSAASHASEVYYVHRRWTRAKALTELRSCGGLTAVAWCPKQGDDGGGSGGGRGASPAAGSTAAGDSCTGPILLGCETGALLEMVLDERQKREAPPKTLIEGLVTAAKDRRNGQAAAASAASASAFTSLYQIALPAGRKALLATTPSHLRLWVAPPASGAAGGGSASPWQALFLTPQPHPHQHSGRAAAAAAAPPPPPPPLAVLEAVSPSPHSQLQLWWPVGLSDVPSRFAWLVGGVLYHGELDWEALAATATGATAGATAAATSGGGEVLSRVAMLPVDGYGSEADGDGDGGSVGFASAAASAADGGSARSLVVTEYHLLLLARDRLRLVNRVNGRTVVERAFRSPLTRSVTGEPSREIDGLVRDLVSGVTYMAVDEALYEVNLQNEAGGMWRVYMMMQDWDAALRCCSGSSQRDEVHRERGEVALAAGDYRTAAVHYAKITDGRPPFEDVALQLADCGDPTALRTFLATRLATLAASLGGARGGGGGGGAAAASLVGSSGGGAAAAAGGGGGGPGLGPERAQCTLVSAWLTELYLDAINKALLEADGEASESYQSAVTALRTHLSDWVHVMDPGTTVSLLASYGRLDELLQLAQLRGDHEGLLEQLMTRKQPGGAIRALAVLRSPAVSRELVYKFAPGLVAAAAEEAVDFFVAQRPPLEPRRLLPALLRYGELDSPPTARRHVLRYVEFAIEELGTTDSVVHNLAVALYSLAPGEEGEAALLRYLTRAGRGGANLTYGGTTPLYDTQYALRLAQECNKPRAAVRLMCQLGMYPDAVRAALALDLGLAKAVAGEPDQDDALRRKLWLQVARHVVETGSKVAAAAAGAGAGSGAAGGDAADPTAHIRTAVEFLREADGLLRIEDILPFFPDFVTIDNFQAAICDSLKRYGAAIEGLKADMEEATAIAEALRADIALLGARSAVVSLCQPCVRCGRPISEAAPLTSLPQGGALPPFYLFPTGCAYHVACCAAEVTELVAPQQRKRIHTLMARLSRVKPGATIAPAYGGAPAADVSALQEALAAEIGCEDPRNGELTVRLLEAPFVYESSDRAEAESWAI
ncbi:hypothetical protein PLESTB_000635800 [Pleodorina starrii]|uniref:Pep3/Vps18 beta-propeller domain-containing protein n=1 Tax=Pleodorina starrii TaxID=330485 RepID=A0A9W6BJ07_9CHLO|nr:hypothetical protein PLESTM_001296800 [Pleodorina starrii]GLC52492.1 hypothetical protein PLESTB_000635800 [Pleodorina starrii]GLC71496.1 hypothetical protein PLESTF_001128100 [Pleodorina starrii]